METTDNSLYPLLFRPNLHTVIWGGSHLSEWKGLGPQDKVGESWEVSAVPGSSSVVDNGVWAGMTLPDVIARMPEAFLGGRVAEQYNNKLPLLVKFIDAEQNLSIQVHPNDEMAQREHGKFGKTEMWYVVDAKPGACLYVGFRKHISHEEFRQRVADGTICDVLAKHEVHTGDVFYIPAGRIHAICGGILLAEVQQSSDVTYRVYDYNRVGMDGKPRQLHVDLAEQAVNFEVEKEYRTVYEADESRAVPVIESPFFSVRVTDVTAPFHRNLVKYDSFIISVCLKGSCKIKIRSNQCEVELKAGCSCLIPAAIADYDIIPMQGTARVLDAFIDKKDNNLYSKLTRFLHITEK